MAKLVPQCKKQEHNDQSEENKPAVNVKQSWGSAIVFGCGDARCGYVAE